jgi:hypothetical protein
MRGGRPGTAGIGWRHLCWALIGCSGFRVWGLEFGVGSRVKSYSFRVEG